VRVAPPALLLLALLLASPGARAAAPARELVLLFTGDGGGELAPCG
jgi:hypothetical protein